MKQIRKNVFETNSSSTHSMVIGTQSDFDRWEAGELFYVSYVWGKEKEYFTHDAGFYTKDEILKYIKENKDDFENFDGTFDDDTLDSLRENEIYSYDEYFDYMDDRGLEEDESTYTTSSGEVIKVVAHYGYDG